MQCLIKDQSALAILWGRHIQQLCIITDVCVNSRGSHVDVFAHSWFEDFRLVLCFCFGRSRSLRSLFLLFLRFLLSLGCNLNTHTVSHRLQAMKTTNTTLTINMHTNADLCIGFLIRIHKYCSTQQLYLRLRMWNRNSDWE